MSAPVARRYFLRGRELLKHGDIDSACQEFANAMELVPDFVEARVGFALTLARIDPPRAAQSLRNGLNRHQRPNQRRQLFCALGDVLLTSGDYLGAEAAYTEATQLGASGLHDRLGRLRAKTGRFAEAIGELLLAAKG
jgi:cytochrome c-type biogenesis protein CcmH/NrfG